MRLEYAANPPAGSAPKFEALDAVWQRRVRQLLNLAAAPGERYLVFERADGDYTYDSENDDEFSRVLSLEDARAVALINNKISSYILLPELPQPQPMEEQDRFFQQLRHAELLAEEIRMERLFGRLPGASNRAL
jgi:hypothetical protein